MVEKEIRVILHEIETQQKASRIGTCHLGQEVNGWITVGEKRFR